MEKAEQLANSIPPGGAEADPPETVDALLGKAKLGDSTAFAGIYDLFAAKIFNFASHMAGSREDAEDITQDTFLLAFRSLKDLREQDRFEQWLFRIARNEVYKKQRKAKAKPESLDDAEKGILRTLRSAHPAGNPETRMLSAELGNKVKAVFDSLPMRYKETLVLATLEGMNYQEISRILGRGLSSVKTDVYRARLMMSEKLGKYLNSEALK